MSWYRIPEIPMSKFVDCLKDIYKVLEKKHVSKTSADPFIESVLKGFNSMSDDQWSKAEKARLAQKALEMKMGDFHEELMGKFAGYETYANGHETGCDVGKLDKTELFEVKNRHNTIKGSDGNKLVVKLNNHAEKGILTVLVQVNCPNGKVNRYGTRSNVKIWNGQEAYKHFSGRDSFFDDLQKTMEHVFKTYKTYDKLKKTLETA